VAVPDKKSQIDIITANYRLLMMSPAMVTNAWVEWTNEPAVMEPLNVRAMKLTKADLQRYVAVSHAQKKAIVGIFRRRGEQQVGIYEIALDQQHMNASIEVLIDIRKYDFEKVVSETIQPLTDYLQKRFDIGKFAAMVPETYSSSLRFFGNSKWELEGVLREELPSLIEGERVSVYQFGLIVK
jgi:hypothetical protein